MKHDPRLMWHLLGINQFVGKWIYQNKQNLLGPRRTKIRLNLAIQPIPGQSDNFWTLQSGGRWTCCIFLLPVLSSRIKHSSRKFLHACVHGELGPSSAWAKIAHLSAFKHQCDQIRSKFVKAVKALCIVLALLSKVSICTNVMKYYW